MESTERVGAVVGVIGHAGHRQRVEGLYEKRPEAADQAGHVTVNRPCGAARAEQPGLRCIESASLRCLSCARQQPSDVATQPGPQALDHLSRLRRRHAVQRSAQRLVTIGLRPSRDRCIR